MGRQKGKHELHKRHNKRRLIIALIAVLLLTGGTTFWILSLLDTIQGPWSNTLPAIFTLLGVVFSLLQWLLPFSSTSSPTTKSTSISETSHNDSKKPPLQVEGFDLGISSRTGALIIYAKKAKLGESIDLRRNPVLLLAYSTSNIIHRNVNNQMAYAAIFPYLEPSDYVACDTTENYRTKITILPNQVTEIDWRNRKSKMNKMITSSESLEASN